MKNTNKISIGQLHQSFINYLKNYGFIRSALVEQAFRAIPRHIFIPNVSPEEAYENKAISTKRLEGMGSVSSSSAPGLMAQMLEQLHLKKGQKILEIGAATGYNAALIGHIVGEKGKVVTIDIDQDLVDGAKEHIKKVGIKNVTVVCRDGILGDIKNAPFDKIILTVGVPDISINWFDQLKNNGLLIIPLELSEIESIHENQPLIVFKKNNDHLESIYIQRSGFMRLRGSHAKSTQGFYSLEDLNGVAIITPVKINPKIINKVLLEAEIKTPTNITVTYRELFGLQLWFSVRLDNYCNLFTKEKVIHLPHFFTRDGKSYSTVGLCSGNSVSILDLEEELKNNTDTSNIIVKTYGGDKNLSNQVIEQIKQWDKLWRPFAYGNDWLMQSIKIKAYPKGINFSKEPNSTLLKKPSMNLYISWGNITKDSLVANALSE